jgi:DNA repair exonuclease SbcCD ATPase subunit|tara:strand:- start:112 stop:438 length:327 start_codon:yes stop_codon:yes gene_type:complete
MTGESNSSWEAYSKMVLKQLENLDQSMNGLRQEIQELKAELAEMRGKQSNVQDLKEWKNKMDEVCSPTQLKELKQEVEDLKLFKAKAITVFAVVQFAMGVILFAKDLL